MTAARRTLHQMDPLAFSLRGSHLIEASAGTGKTWTIAALYIRLVLGHGGQPARLPDEILVLTFTEAAARELRDRIRARLSQAAQVFASPDDAQDDPFLMALRADYAADQWPSRARVLDLAAQSMDEAAIDTIHAWCARALQEHAFDSGSLFEQQLQPDLDAPVRTVAWDYWRAQVEGLDEAGLAAVLAVWPGPAQLLTLAPLLTQDGVPSEPGISLQQVCADAAATRQAALQRLKEPWGAWVDALSDWLEAAGKDLKGLAHLRGWAARLGEWAQDPHQEIPALTDTAWKGLSAAGIMERWKGSTAVVPPAASQALETLRADLASLPSMRAPLLAHALGWMAARLRHQLNLLAAMGFDGLLTGLDDALSGAQGETLAQTIRRQFPVMMVDEFQDTDPVQYRIFDRVYDVARNDPETLLILIGDPKQSIYGFRHADVHTYLRAARDCGDRVQTLARNFRSSAPLVDAVNRVFTATGDTPFITGVAGETIAFQPVQAQGRPEQWQLAGCPARALNVHWIDAEDPAKALTLTPYRERAATWCAQRVATLLALGRRDQAGFAHEGSLEPVRPADIAVLVNRGTEADLVRQALADRGVRSVYLSERDSVYQTPLALELAVCLQACAQPEDERSVRAALATPLLGLDAAGLDMLVNDESAWDAQVERFQGYHRSWQLRGVLPMVRMLLHDFDVPSRLLAAGHDGERRLTDCLHLAELLQQAAAHLDGEQALLRHLQQQRESSTDEDARRLRLESDEDLVRVVTVHKSKGLEYPLVFLPFAATPPSDRTGAGHPVRLIQDGHARWVMTPDAAQARQLVREQLGEEVRKLYVALTRARHAIWLACGPVARLEDSGLAQTVGADPRAAWDGLMAGADAPLAWDDAPPAEQSLAGGEAESRPLGPGRRLKAPVVRNPWWIASYSALQVRGGNAAPLSGAGSVGAAELAAPETAAEDVLREDLAVVPPLEGPQTLADSLELLPSALSAFPRGSEAGTFLHGLLEWAARCQFAHLEDARDVIARRCVVRGWEAHIDTLHQWLLDLSATIWHPALPDQPALCFSTLQACLPEMEFWLPSARVDVARLDGLIRTHVFGGHDRPALAPVWLNGMFKGFIDLVLQAQGRYYLVDYKSNDLGPHAADYGQGALVAAMCGARYDVQMMMYILALHRQLGARLPDYDYDRHMGGALYLFLRGQTAPGQGLLACRPPRALVESLDALFAGRTEAARA